LGMAAPIQENQAIAEKADFALPNSAE